MTQIVGQKQVIAPHTVFHFGLWYIAQKVREYI